MNQITLGALAQGFIENGLDVLLGKLLWFKAEEHGNTLTALPVYLFVYRYRMTIRDKMMPISPVAANRMPAFSFEATSDTINEKIPA